MHLPAEISADFDLAEQDPVLILDEATASLDAESEMLSIRTVLSGFPPATTQCRHHNPSASVVAPPTELVGGASPLL